MNPFFGEIRLMPFNFAPRGWALCQGQLMSIAQNTALFSLLGTTYGGDGRTTFALPDLRGRSAQCMGQGAGLANYPLGAQTGMESVALQPATMPAHSHGLTASVGVNKTTGTLSSPADGCFAADASAEQYGDSPVGGGAKMAADIFSGVTQPIGGGQAHENRMPYLVLNYAIATQGVFPQRP